MQLLSRSDKCRSDIAVSDSSHNNKYGYGDAAPDVSELPTHRMERTQLASNTAQTSKVSSTSSRRKKKVDSLSVSDHTHNRKGCDTQTRCTSMIHKTSTAVPDAPSCTRSLPSRTVSAVSGRRIRKKKVDPLSVSDHTHNRQRHLTPRRSSMKHEETYGIRRRASITDKGELEIRLPNTTKRVTRRRSIGFHEEIDVKLVEPVSELTEKPEDLWFQDK